MMKRKYISEKRAQLIHYTQQAQKMIDEGFTGSHNRAIVQLYKSEGHGKVFKTLERWNAAGYLVKLGQKGLPVWDKSEELDIMKKPMIYIFSQEQVFKVNEPRRHAPPVAQVPEQKTESIQIPL